MSGQNHRYTTDQPRHVLRSIYASSHSPQTTASYKSSLPHHCHRQSASCSEYSRHPYRSDNHSMYNPRVSSVSPNVESSESAPVVISALSHGVADSQSPLYSSLPNQSQNRNRDGIGGRGG